MADYVLFEKACAFTKRIMKLELYLKQQSNCSAKIIDQVLRSGTSVGANIAESMHAESRKDFIHKLKVALKEADETLNWLEGIKDTYNVHQVAMTTLTKDLNEIRYILLASIKTARRNQINESANNIIIEDVE